MRQFETMMTDVLIFGAGAAGIRASLAAKEEGADVIIVARDKITNDGSTFSRISKGWGIQAIVGPERTDKNLQAFYDDIIQAGLGQCDPKLVRILVEESGSRLEDLISCGIRLRKDQGGDYLRVKGCFSNTERAFLTDDFANVQQTFRSITERSSAKLITGYALDLIISENACWGAWIIANTGEIVRINAKATILATGGGAGVYKDHLVSDNDVGDGYALAYQAGAELINMEFIQFMLGLKNNGTRGFLPVSGLQEPGVLSDSEGRDLMQIYFDEDPVKDRALKDRQKHFPFSSRDTSCQIDIAVARTKENGDKVFWNGNGSKGKGIEVVHCAHAFNGGVKIDERAQSTVSGLYAAGEVAAGSHGADRLGGSMMAATQVFGKIAGESAAKRAKKMREKAFADFKPGDLFKWFCHETDNEDQDVFEIRQTVRDLLGKYAAVLRNEQGFRVCLMQLDNCESGLNYLKTTKHILLKDFFEVRHMITVARLITTAAMKRKESCGSHFMDSQVAGTGNIRGSFDIALAGLH